jgi:hypothetical protein
MFGRERQGAEGNLRGEQRQAGGQQQEENAKQEANNKENKENNAKLEQTIKTSLNFHVYKSFVLAVTAGTSTFVVLHWLGAKVSSRLI